MRLTYKCVDKEKIPESIPTEFEGISKEEYGPSNSKPYYFCDQYGAECVESPTDLPDAYGKPFMLGNLEIGVVILKLRHYVKA